MTSKKNLLLIGSFIDKGIIAYFNEHKYILYNKNNKKIIVMVYKINKTYCIK